MQIQKFTVFFLSLWWIAFAAPNQDILGKPSETIVFKIPKENTRQWKVVDQIITEKNCVLVYMPSQQHENFGADRIRIEYLCNDKVKNLSVDGAIKKYKARCPDKANRISFEVLEKNTSDCMYEEILEYEGKRISVLSRFFLKNGSLHSIEIERYSQPWTLPQRKELVKMLKEGVSIERTDKVVADTPVLSFAYKSAETLDLGHGFKHWELFNRKLDLQDSWVITWIPGISREMWSELLFVICSKKTRSTNTLEEFVQEQMKVFEKRAKKQLEFHVIKKLPKEEIIYSFVMPLRLFSVKKTIQVTTIVRAIPQERKYYEFIYQSNHKLSPEEIIEWQGKLEGISVIK
jgi:hypothetical protein